MNRPLIAIVRDNLYDNPEQYDQDFWGYLHEDMEHTIKTPCCIAGLTLREEPLTPEEWSDIDRCRVTFAELAQKRLQLPGFISLHIFRAVWPGGFDLDPEKQEVSYFKPTADEAADLLDFILDSFNDDE